MALYQDIMKVPGLSGSSYQRQKQYWEKLGHGPGYSGSYDQNIKLLGNMGKSNYGLATQKKAASPNVARATGKVDEYTQNAQGPKTETPFSEMLPFYKAWEQISPMAERAAAQQVTPEIMRDYMQTYRDYMGGMASSGGGRFGGGWGGVGGMQAAAERQRKERIQDWMGVQEAGFQELFYNPAEEAWKLAMTQGEAGVMPEVPTWEEYATQYGLDVPTGGPEVTSPFVGDGVYSGSPLDRYKVKEPRWKQWRDWQFGDRDRGGIARPLPVLPYQPGGINRGGGSPGHTLPSLPGQKGSFPGTSRGF